MEDAEQQDVLHQQPVGHQGRGDAGRQQHLRQGVGHVLPAAAHVQLLQLTADGRHVGLTQPEGNGDLCEKHLSIWIGDPNTTLLEVVIQ